MILTCPRCATRYLVDADQLWTTGRTVQCDDCGQRWRATGSGERAPPSPEPPPPPEPESGPTSEAVSAPADTVAEAVQPPPSPPPPEPPTVTLPPKPEPSPVAAPRPAEAEFPPVPGFTPLEPLPSATPAPPPAAEAALFLQRPKRQTETGHGPPGLGRALAILFLLGMVVAVLVLFQEPIVRAAPGLAPFYSAVGLSNFNPPGVGAHG